MRIGKPGSASYRNLYQRQQRRRHRVIERLCHRLDRLVERAESLRTGATRLNLLSRADRVREDLRVMEH